ncbi:MAG: alpha/beta fold hydrolase [Clostridia bacterium]|nr:alpha/beta fold hydrolase [Clostridia bacterium]
MGIVILIIIIILCIILATIYWWIGNYFYKISLNPKTDKEFAIGELAQTAEEIKRQENEKKWLTDNSKDVYITSTNNGILKLHAYEINDNEDSNVWVIVIHGYMSSGSGMATFAHEFNKKGYNILVTDLRGHGNSQGDYIGMGWHDRLDIIDWINYIIKKNQESQIIIYGISMGAATTMMTTGEKLPSNVKLAIADCGYTSAWDEFSYQLKRKFKLPEFPVLYAANGSCKRHAKYSFKEASSVEQVKKSNTPTLFIHGDSDDFVPFNMLDTIYNSASCKKEKLVIKNADHGEAASVNPELYWSTIDKFINKYM